MIFFLLVGSLLVVTGKFVGTVHKCLQCRAFVHIWCGTYDKEGFGQSNICFNCEKPSSADHADSISNSGDAKKASVQPSVSKGKIFFF